MRKGSMTPDGQLPTVKVDILSPGLYQVMWDFQEVTRQDMDDEHEQTIWEYTFVNTSEYLEGVPFERKTAAYQAMGKTETEIEKLLWLYPQWAKRIVAPVELILDDIGIKIYGWFQINGFPVEKVDDTTVHLYCNMILPQHQAIVDQLDDVIFIEDSPYILT